MVDKLLKTWAQALGLQPPGPVPKASYFTFLGFRLYTCKGPEASAIND